MEIREHATNVQILSWFEKQTAMPLLKSLPIMTQQVAMVVSGKPIGLHIPIPSPNFFKRRAPILGDGSHSRETNNNTSNTSFSLLKFRHAEQRPRSSSAPSTPASTDSYINIENDVPLFQSETNALAIALDMPGVEQKEHMLHPAATYASHKLETEDGHYDDDAEFDGHHHSSLAAAHRKITAKLRTAIRRLRRPMCPFRSSPSTNSALLHSTH